jgi:hypothetical protein
MRMSQIPAMIVRQLYQEDSDRLIKIKTALFDPRLSNQEKLLFIHILSNAPDKDNRHDLHPEMLKNLFGYQRDRKPTYHKLLENLITKGYIDIVEDKIIILV